MRNSLFTKSCNIIVILLILSLLHQIPRDDEGEPLYEDFICTACSTVCSFLSTYPQTIWAAGLRRNAGCNTNKDKDVLEEIPSAGGSGKLENGICSNGSPREDNAIANTSAESVTGGKGVTGESSKKIFDLVQCMNDGGAHIACLFGDNIVVDGSISLTKPLFLSKNWRATLCRCKKCLSMYEQKRVSYLIDEEDSIAEYERTAKQKREEKLQQQEGAELTFLNKLGHVEKMEILNGIADMKDEFHNFLVCFQ